MSIKHSALSKILGSVAVIALVATLSVGATVAYFSGTKTETATIATARIGVASSGFPITYSNMLPGETQYTDVYVGNSGSAAADLFVQLVGSGSGTELNFCIPTPVLDIAIEDLDLGGYWHSGTICNLYPGQATSVIVKVADDVPSGGWKHLRVHLTLAPTAGNEYQNGSNTDTVNLIAVQHNGPPPAPNTDGFSSGAYADAWPLDNFGSDQDPNYP